MPFIERSGSTRFEVEFENDDQITTGMLTGTISRRVARLIRIWRHDDLGYRGLGGELLERFEAWAIFHGAVRWEAHFGPDEDRRSEALDFYNRHGVKYIQAEAKLTKTLT